MSEDAIEKLKSDLAGIRDSLREADAHIARKFCQGCASEMKELTLIRFGIIDGTDVEIHERARVCQKCLELEGGKIILRQEFP